MSTNNINNKDLKAHKFVHSEFRRLVNRSYSQKITSTQQTVDFAEYQYPSNLTQVSLSPLWYRWHADSIRLLKGKDSLELVKMICDYTSTDAQFPPDINKLLRLNYMLNIIQPKSIVEIGCGTSSLIMYYYSLRFNIPYLCIDESEDWLKTTQNKIDQSITINNKYGKFVHHKAWENSVDTLNKFASCHESRFIFLDASLDTTRDKTGGMDFIIDSLNNNHLNTFISIDCRKMSIKKLNLLAKKVDKDIYCTTNILNYKKEDKNISVQRQNLIDEAFTTMNGSTLASF